MANNLSYLNEGRPPALLLDQEEKALIADLRGLGGIAVYAKPGLPPNRAHFYEELVIGDSGNPAFLIVNNSMVLLSTATGGYGFEYGTFVTDQISILNAMISDADADATAVNPNSPIDTNLQIQPVDLSEFDTFTAP